MLIISFILLGLITGILAGLLGIGGGIITVPTLYYLLKYQDLGQDTLMRTCISTALAATVLTSIGSTFSHYRKKALRIHILKLMIPGLIGGCICGAFLSTILSGNILKVSFGCMAICLAIYLFFPKLPPLHIAHEPNRSLTFFGMIIGSLSTLLGIGGGIFMVPLLMGYKVPIQHTIANSSAGTFITSFCGTIAYLILSEKAPSLSYSIGYINLIAACSIGIGSLCTTSLGCKLAHILPANRIKKIFSIALAITGLSMILH